jgi:hypothetical protein
LGITVVKNADASLSKSKKVSFLWKKKTCEVEVVTLLDVFFEFGRTRLQLLRIIFYFFSLLGVEKKEEEEKGKEGNFWGDASKTTYDNITIFPCAQHTTCTLLY